MKHKAFTLTATECLFLIVLVLLPALAKGQIPSYRFNNKTKRDIRYIETAPYVDSLHSQKWTALNWGRGCAAGEEWLPLDIPIDFSKGAYSLKIVFADGKFPSPESIVFPSFHPPDNKGDITISKADSDPDSDRYVLSYGP
jgi:hypothetical protein